MGRNKEKGCNQSNLHDFFPSSQESTDKTTTTSSSASVVDAAASIVTAARTDSLSPDNSIASVWNSNIIDKRAKRGVTL